MVNFKANCFLKYLLRLKEFLFTSESPPKTALAFTVGFYLGIFPVIGTTTILCIVVSFIFRLNPLILQLMNVILSPVQLILVYPMLKAGRLLFFMDKKVFPVANIEQRLIDFRWDSVLYFLPG